METIIWSCAFPLRFVQIELFFGVDDRSLTDDHLTACLWPVLYLLASISTGEKVTVFPVYCPFKGHLIFYRLTSVSSTAPPSLPLLFSDEFHLWKQAASLSAAQMFLSHLLTGSLQCSHPAHCFWSQSWSPSRSVVLLFCGGGMGLEV